MATQPLSISVSQIPSPRRAAAPAARAGRKQGFARQFARTIFLGQIAWDNFPGTNCLGQIAWDNLHATNCTWTWDASSVLMAGSGLSPALLLYRLLHIQIPAVPFAAYTDSCAGRGLLFR